MSISKYLSIQVKDGVVQVRANDNAVTITFVGASCASSASPGATSLTSFCLSPERGKKAVFAVTVLYRAPGREADQSHAFLLELTWSEDLVKCDFNHLFVPSQDRLAQVRHNGPAISVKTGVGENERRFAATSWPQDHAEYVRNGYQLADANRICQFIIGDITLEELEKEAEESQAAKDAREIKRLQDELASQKGQHAGVQRELVAANQRLASLTEQHQGSQQRFTEIQERHNAFVLMIIRIQEAISDSGWRQGKQGLITKILGIIAAGEKATQPNLPPEKKKSE